MAAPSNAEALRRLHNMLICATEMADELADAAESAINCEPHGMSNLLMAVTRYREVMK